MRQPQAHAIARAIPRRLLQSLVAMAPGPRVRLLVVVHPGSDDTDPEWCEECSIDRKRSGA